MSNIQNQIGSLLQRRKEHLPSVQAEVERWKQIDCDIQSLAATVNELRSHPRTPPEVKQGLFEFQPEKLRKEIATTVELLQILAARYARDTLNIGVSGRARVGKSTLLRSLSGLTDEQIPTGSCLPVTAVRSRIFHSATHQRATLTLHTFESFRSDILVPYHQELGLLSPPLSATEFQSWKYPASETELDKDSREKHSSVSLLRRLREMQTSFDSYKNDLTGETREVPLADLRQYVAYPTNTDINQISCPRRYLAVQDVRIECNFPYAQVNHLGMIDLPGLGELASNAEQSHLAGLKNEVDIVLLVTRPSEGMAYWRKEDSSTTDLLDKARGFIKNRRDFVCIVLNGGDPQSPLMTSLRDDIRRQANDCEDGKHFIVLEGDAAEPKSVATDILLPALKHLANRLPVMDDEVFEGTKTDYLTLSSKIESALSDLSNTLSIVRQTSGSTEELDNRTTELRKDLASALTHIVEDHRQEARSGDDDDAYVNAVEATYNDTKNWIDSGFGIGREEWCKNALRQMKMDRGSSTFAAKEFNSIRVEISGRFCSLDHYFTDCITTLWNELADVFNKNCGEVLHGAHGVDALRILGTSFSDASEPCPTLNAAVQDILKLKLEYRTQLHPRVREKLDGLNLQVTNPENGKPHNQVTVDANESGAEELFQSISQLAIQAAYETKKALMREASIPALVLHAAAEQFEDALIRSAASEKEFKRFTRSFRDDLWPNVFTEIDETNSKFSKVLRAIEKIKKNLITTRRG